MSRTRASRRTANGVNRVQTNGVHRVAYLPPAPSQTEGNGLAPAPAPEPAPAPSRRTAERTAGGSGLETGTARAIRLVGNWGRCDPRSSTP